MTFKEMNEKKHASVGFNANMAAGKWTEIKGEVQKEWGKLTNDELEKTKGDMKAISGLIQQKYGAAQKGFDEKLNVIFKHIKDEKSKIVDSTKAALKK